MTRYRVTALSWLSVFAASVFICMTGPAAFAQGTVPESALKGPSYSLQNKSGQNEAVAPALPPGAPPLPGTPIGPDTAPAQPASAPPTSLAEPRSSTNPPMAAMDDMSRAYISSLQRALPSHGYHAGPQTGDLDAATETAILDYQRDAGMTEDAHSPMSLKATLDSVSFAKPPIMAHGQTSRLRYSAPPIADGSMHWVQERLNAKGYDVGRPDGLMGRRTADAVMAFETEHGLPRQAAVTPALIDRLRQ